MWNKQFQDSRTGMVHAGTPRRHCTFDFSATLVWRPCQGSECTHSGCLTTLPLQTLRYETNNNKGASISLTCGIVSSHCPESKLDWDSTRWHHPCN
ncbi:hypothetical protein VTK56DRAFT_962 [Thermocarpiscus australiensis]